MAGPVVTSCAFWAWPIVFGMTICAFAQVTMRGNSTSELCLWWRTWTAENVWAVWEGLDVAVVAMLLGRWLVIAEHEREKEREREHVVAMLLGRWW